MAKFVLSHDAQDIDDTIDEVQAARGSEASLSARLADIVSDFEADQQRQETEIGVVAAMGAKNLLQITAESQTKNGVEMAVNTDGTLTFTRTAAASSDSYFTIATFTGDAGRFYTLAGCPQGGTDSTFYQHIGGTFRDYGSGVTRDGGTLRNVVVFISKNYSPDNLVFKPMLRPAEITDDTFVPYAPTNRELYEENNQLQAKVDQITGTGQQIPSNADLNSYYDPGVYQILSSAIAQTLANIPSDCKVAGSIEVKILNGSARMQFYYPNWASSGTNPGSFYFRQRTGTTAWTGWYYFSGTSDASVQSAPASLMQAGRIGAELTDAQEVTENDT